MAYSINTIPFENYNLVPLSSIGAMDIPKRLGKTEHDWQDGNGVEPYVEAADLSWDGREISILFFYNGSNLFYDLNLLRSLYEGQDVTLITSYGTHSARMKSIKENATFSPNGKAVVVIQFWETTVPVPTPASPSGGNNPTLDGYSFWSDFSMVVQEMKLLYDNSYHKRELTYSNTPPQYSAYRPVRKCSITLYGKYPTPSAMLTAVNNLHGVVRQPGMKVLEYHSITANTYYADTTRVKADIKRANALVRLNLRIADIGVDVEGGGAIIFPTAGIVEFPASGVVTFDN